MANNQKLIITLGLPASGKSTFASKLAEENPETHIRVCRDDIRHMLGTYWVPAREKVVTMIENASVDAGLHKGFNVIVDATNFSSFNKWKDLAKELKIEFEIKDFTDVPLRTCIERDQQRERPVGKIVIEGMWQKYINK